MVSTLPATVSPTLEEDWDTFCAIEDEIGVADTTSIEARWRCGKLLVRYEKHERSKNSPLAEAVRRLSRELDISEAELYNRRQFAEEYPDNCSYALEQFGSWHEVVASGLGNRGSTAHVSNNSGDNEWYTPRPYIEAAVRVMGGIDMDPASTAEANEIVGASQFYDEQTDGLKHSWAGRVWMNPPYARPLIDEFCGKLADSFANGDVSEACVLVNNATETGWFHALAEVAGALCFPRHRVKFWHPRKESVPLQGQAVIYLGTKVESFRAEFLQFGFTVML